MSFLVWLLLAVVYLLLLAVFGVTSWRRGHTVLFFVGFFLPLLWIVGSFMRPTSASSAAAARANLR
ncbi:MAG: hypothetical protein QOG77_3652 [Solirubrobacteraceae bacterium]|nr:hypothetical protein [Solirubrobacteraceae bacterium]